MHFFNKELLERARSFIDDCLEARGEEPSIVIAYHGDGDGCGAAYFLCRYLQRDVDFYWVSTPGFDFANTEAFLLEQKPRLVIFLDMPVYNRIEMIHKVRSNGRVFIYDHHYPGTCEIDNHDPGVLYINPIVHQDGESCPSALFGWELLTEKGIVEREILFMSLYTETWSKEVALFEDFTRQQRDLLKDLAKLVHSSFLIRDMNTTHYALNFLFKLGSEGIFGNGEYEKSREYQILKNIFQLVQNEKSWVARQLAREIKKIRDPAFILKGIESQIRLCGIIASELRWQYPHLVVGIWQRWDRKYICELRRGNSCETNLVSLIDHVKSETGRITGGGHPAAAAFTGEGKDFFAALRRIKELLRHGGKESPG